MSKAVERLYRHALAESQTTARELQEETESLQARRDLWKRAAKRQYEGNERLLSAIRQRDRARVFWERQAKLSALQEVVRALEPMACLSDDVLAALGVVRELLKQEEG